MTTAHTWIEAGIFDSVLEAKQYRNENYKYSSYITERYNSKRVKLYIKKQNLN